MPPTKEQATRRAAQLERWILRNGVFPHVVIAPPPTDRLNLRCADQCQDQVRWRRRRNWRMRIPLTGFYGWRAPRPPRVVFVIGFASLIHSLTSGTKTHTCACTCILLIMEAGPASAPGPASASEYHLQAATRYGRMLPRGYTTG